MIFFYSETTSIKCIYVGIIHRQFIVIDYKNEKIDPEEHYPQNINSHCIISHGTP